MDGYVPQSPAEKQYFDYLWDIANNRAPGSDPSGLGELSGGLAVQFFQRSSVDRGFLKNIWSLSTPSATMNAQQFYTALRFITMIQNGEIPISKERLQSTSKENLGLPRFTGIDLPAPAKPVATVPTPVPVVPTAVPGAAVPHPAGVPQAHGHAPHAHAMPPFAMTPQEHVKYHSLFVSYDSNHDGFLSKDEALPIYQKSGMDMARVEMIYAMVDEDRDGLLTPKEFCAAFHIIVCVTKRNHAMPPSLPPALHHFLINAPAVPPTPGAMPPVVHPPVGAAATPVVAAGVPPIAPIAAVPVPTSTSVPAPAPAPVPFVMPVTPVTPTAAPLTPLSVSDAFGDMVIPATTTAAPATTLIEETPPHHGSSFDAFDDHHPVTSTTNVVMPPAMDTVPIATQPVDDAFAAFDSHVPAQTTSFKLTAESPVVMPVSVTQPEDNNAHDAFSAFPALDTPPLATPPTVFANSVSHKQVDDHHDSFAAFEAIPATSTVSTSVSSTSNTTSSHTTTQLRAVQQSVSETQQQQLRHMQEWRQDLTEESSVLQDAVSQMQQENESLRQQLQETAQAVENLMSEVKTKRQLLVSAVQERSSLQKEVSQAESQRAQLQQEVDTLSAQLVALSDNNTTSFSSEVEEFYATLLQDTRVAQPRLLQLLQQDVSFLQTCKQSFAAQIEKLKRSSVTTQTQEVKRLETERDRQTQALQRIQQEQQATIDRLTREKQALMEQVQSVSHDRDTPRRDTPRRDTPRDVPLLQETDARDEEASFDFDKAYPEDTSVAFETHHFPVSSAVATHGKDTAGDDKKMEDDTSETGVFDTHRDTEQEAGDTDIDAFGYAAFPETQDDTHNGDAFVADAAFDTNDPFATHSSGDTPAAAAAAVSSEEDPFAGFASDDTHKEESGDATHAFAFGGDTDPFFSETDTHHDATQTKDSDTVAVSESQPAEKDPFFSGDAASATDEFESDPFGDAAVSSFAEVVDTHSSSEKKHETNDDPFAAEFESDPFGGSAEDKVEHKVVSSDDPFASSAESETAKESDAKVDVKAAEAAVDTKDETAAEEDLFPSSPSHKQVEVAAVEVEAAAVEVDDGFGSFGNTDNTVSDGFDDFDAFGSETVGVAGSGVAAIDSSFTLEADPFGLPTPSGGVAAASGHDDTSDPFFASSSEKKDVNDNGATSAAATGEEDPFASFD